MCLLFCLRQTRWGAGPGPLGIDREVMRSDMTDCRWFGRAPDFSEGSVKERIGLQPAPPLGASLLILSMCPTSKERFELEDRNCES